MHHRQLPHQFRFGYPLSWHPNELFASFKLAEKRDRISIKANGHTLGSFPGASETWSFVLVGASALLPIRILAF